MSCNHCNTKFNFFHKELGCANCGLSFCNKCLKQKSKLPARGYAELPVCRVCYDSLSSPSSSNANQMDIIVPPEAYLKRLEALENPVAPPITIYKNNPRNTTHLRDGLSPADVQLLNRLEKLKDNGKGPPPSEQELRERLNSLKGLSNTYTDQKPKYITTKDLRSDEEKVDGILEMFMHERDIELTHNPQDTIEVRIASLREQGVRPNEGSYMQNLHDKSSDDEETEVEKITKKIMHEVKLDERCPIRLDADSGQSNDPEMETDELPWCVLCNNDATVRCLDCEDLYCTECHRDVHSKAGDYDHRVVPYKPPK